MVHQYKNNGYNIVLDVNSGAIHVVDDVTYDVIELFEDSSAKEIIEKLVDRYPQTEIEEAIQEVNELKDNEELFTEDTYKERIIDFKKRQTVCKGTLPSHRARLQPCLQILFCRGGRVSRQTSSHELRDRKTGT